MTSIHRICEELNVKSLFQILEKFGGHLLNYMQTIVSELGGCFWPIAAVRQSFPKGTSAAPM
ncbi:MAG TPA: hypothetical protein VLR45_09230, partial [Desulfoprunum sp.]|nr:hypothetical protein [Desulfoprunum sp.]